MKVQLSFIPGRDKAIKEKKPVEHPKVSVESFGRAIEVCEKIGGRHGAPCKYKDKNMCLKEGRKIDMIGECRGQK